mmetsp:Transcript_32442/g.31717  ORF Transcript_32442/g.31717 Transcript_32442/m.31717 type:complete len:103 (-) Transcript_32442:59-367(-)
MAPKIKHLKNKLSLSKTQDVSTYLKLAHEVEEKENQKLFRLTVAEGPKKGRPEELGLAQKCLYENIKAFETNNSGKGKKVVGHGILSENKRVLMKKKTFGMQ